MCSTVHVTCEVELSWLWTQVEEQKTQIEEMEDARMRLEVNMQAMKEQFDR